jgi:hypothetical protein
LPNSVQPTHTKQRSRKWTIDTTEREWLEHEEAVEDEDELGDDVAGEESESDEYEAMGDDFAAHQRQTEGHARLMVGRERDPNRRYPSRGAMNRKDFFRDAPETQAARTRDAPMQTHCPGTTLALRGRPHAFVRGPVEGGGEL